MYIETSSPRTRGQKARFVSPMRQPTTGSCFAYWYHMYGSTIGSLTLYRQSNGARNLLWTRSGGQGNVWRMGMQTVSSSSNYQVRFVEFFLSIMRFEISVRKCSFMILGELTK